MSQIFACFFLLPNTKHKNKNLSGRYSYLPIIFSKSQKSNSFMACFETDCRLLSLSQR